MPKNQSKIVIASVLKPVTDPRMFEKFAKTLHHHFEIHIIGSPIKKIPPKPAQIHFHFLKKLKRWSKKRFLFSLYFYKKLTEIQPNILIVNSPELLIGACFYRLIHRTVVIYDIRENYFKNLWFQRHYSAPWRYGLACAVRSLEILSRLFVRHYILAEKSYANELQFTKNKRTIIENKFTLLQDNIKFNKKKTKGLNFIYTGTISEVYGTWEAIEFVEKLHKKNPTVRLLIIGSCSQSEYYKKITQKAENQDFISLQMQETPVSHRLILDAIQQADFGILSYQNNASITNCIPTKLYEFLAFQIPVIIPKNPLWEKLVFENQAGFSIDFQNFKAESVLQKIEKMQFYSVSPPKSSWEFDSESLLKLIQKFDDF